MKSAWFKNILPHLIAIVIFLAVAAIFCKPALKPGMVLIQSDVAGWQGMAQNSTEYHKLHGYAPLWTPAMFGGMPTYQIGFESPWTPYSMFNTIFSLGLPKPLNFFFLACICFYIFCMCVRVRPWIAIISSLAFAYASFVPIIISAGHETQMIALAYTPALLGAVILVYERKYLLGFTLTALFTMLNIGSNHQQISYYFFLIAAIMSVFYIIKWIREKNFSHMIKALGLVAAGGIVGVMVSATVLFVTSDYTKYSKRGGQLVLDKKAPGNAEEAVAVGSNKTSGLTKDYAFMWSYGKTETFTLLYPGIMGYGARGGELNEKAHVAKYLEEKMNQPSDQAAEFAQSMAGRLYWGDQPFTEGPVYLGAIVCFLFIFGLIYLKGHHKWWILTAVILTIMMSWGKNFPGFNYFIFDHLPLYNKFRVPTMILVVPQILFAIMAALALEQLVARKESEEETWKAFKISVISMAGVFALSLAMYMSMDYKAENSARTTAFNQIIASRSADMNAQIAGLNEKFPPRGDNQLYESLVSMTQGNTEAARGIVNALHEDRASVFGKNILRSFIFVSIAVFLMGYFIKKHQPNDTIFIAALGLLIMIDLFPIGQKYLNENNFTEADQYEAQTFPKSEADEIILKDKEPNFRVFNMAGGDPFQESRTSYYHNSVGGYSPAKLGIYDDLINYQLSGSPNPQVLNMLNTKYIIQPDASGKPMAGLNNARLGNCWIVKSVRFVNGPAEEMTALTNLNPKDTALVDASFKAQFPAGIQFDSAATIKMVKFDNTQMEYASSASSPQIAIFSEIYYPAGWDIYIDGKKSEYFKANYVLRGAVIPAGNHKIEFKFEPRSYFYGTLFARIFSWLIMLMLGVVAFTYIRKFLQSGKTENK